MTQIWAHRGCRREAPENTLPAFDLAIRQGADGVEFDTQLTADGTVVVMHDETVDRTTDGTGPVVGFSLDRLRELDASAGFAGVGRTPVPTLAEVLSLVAPSPLALNIELKNSVEPYPGMEEQVLAAVAGFGLSDRVMLSSFNHYSLRRVQELDPTIPLGMLYTDPLYKPWRYAASLGVAAIHPPARFVLGERYIRRCHAAGLAVRPWVVNGRRALARMVSWGADGVFTDVPALALKVRGAASLP